MEKEGEQDRDLQGTVGGKGRLVVRMHAAGDVSVIWYRSPRGRGVYVRRKSKCGEEVRSAADRGSKRHFSGACIMFQKSKDEREKVSMGNSRSNLRAASGSRLSRDRAGS